MPALARRAPALGAWLAALVIGGAMAPGARAQVPPAATGRADSSQKGPRQPKKPKDPAPLYRDESPLTLTLTSDFRQLRRDRGDDPPWRAATISYADSGGRTIVVPARVRARGRWRRTNCDLPPIRINFAKDSVRHTIFAQLDKPKLVSACHGGDDWEQYVLQELQLYRVYALVTPLAFRARLARVTYMDSGAAKPRATRWAIITEDLDELAQRTGTVPTSQEGAMPSDLESDHSALFGIFQYFAGNTDFSISRLHNVELVRDDSAYYAIPYDFDWSGIVGAPYAVPDPQLAIRNVRERLYRGYCTPRESVDRAIARFVVLRDSIAALYGDSIGSLLAPGRARETGRYVDELYAVLLDPREVKRRIVDACYGK